MDGNISQLHEGRGTNKKSGQRPEVLLNNGYQLLKHVDGPKLLKTSDPNDTIRVSQRDRDGGEQITLTKLRVSLKGMYVWGSHST